MQTKSGLWDLRSHAGKIVIKGFKKLTLGLIMGYKSATVEKY